MNRFVRSTGCITFLFTLLLPQASMHADADGTRGIAAVAVARAALELADEQPPLPDSAKANSKPEPANNSLDSLISNSSDPAQQVSDTLHDAVIKGTDAQTTLATPIALQPIKFEIVSRETISNTLPAQLVIGSWDRGCSACTRLEKDIRTVLTPLGWTIGDHPQDQIRFVQLPHSEAVPKITLFQNGSAIETWDRYTDPGSLSRALRNAWDTAPLPAQSKLAGSTNAIHARNQIRAVLSYFREYVGDGNKAALSWERSGDSEFPILKATQEWSALAIFGASGHIRLTASKTLKLPVSELGFGYGIDGSDFLIDADRVRVRGLADRLSLARSFESASPSGLFVLDDMVYVWNVISAVHGIFSLLNPELDIVLPGQIQASAILKGGTLSVEFIRAPKVKIVALFAFSLDVRRIDVSEKSVRILFDGSRLVKERTFPVVE